MFEATNKLLLPISEGLSLSMLLTAYIALLLALFISHCYVDALLCTGKYFKKLLFKKYEKKFLFALA